MQTTGTVLAATAPLYLLILAGFGAVRLRLFTAEHMRVLGRFVTLIALPALLFRAMSGRPLDQVVQPRYLLAYGAASLAVLGFAWLWARRLRRADSAKSALLALGMVGSNSAFIGYPVAAQLLGAPLAGIGLALCMLVENLLLIPLALAAADAGGAAGGVQQRLSSIARTLLRNPLIIAIFVGITVSALEIPVPAVLTQTVQIVAGSASPLALFVIGGVLVGLKPGGMLGDVAAIAFGKLVLHPAAVFAAFALWPLADPQLQRAAMVFATAPIFGIYPVLAQKYGLEGLCAAALLAATTLSFISMNVWLALL